ncbi:MAG: prepilin-type N-terminal cleavage/methylation domain-containing protein [Gammaproteobacteria bacterium]|nr:MAG: prepilin-type N-terminal cleavage/methylation domain-containing protein [Gammaproteobacteria bacterium]
MQSRSAQRPSRAAGFTLVELMVVVAIATILFAIAVPSYITYVRQSRRTEARTAVLDLAGREERFFSTNGAAYTNTPGQLGYTALASTAPIGGGYYYLTVCTVPPAASCPPSAIATAPAYTVTATPVAGQSQENDAQCTSFSVDSAGQQYASGSGGATVATPYCWAN